MAWYCSGKTNTELIMNMYKRGLITTKRVRNAMLKVDRAHYVLSHPYEDSPQPIGWGATISAPHMHASAAEALAPFLRSDSRVLDVGSGSGYLTAVLAELALDQENEDLRNASMSTQVVTPVVVGVEHIESLRELGQKNLAKNARGKQLIADGIVRFVLGDGRKGWVDGFEDENYIGWDVIHVGAAAKELHEELIKQLRHPGRLFIPVEEVDENSGDSNLQRIWIVDKSINDQISKVGKEFVRYVPLTDAPGSL